MEPEQADAALEKITQDGVIEKLRSQYGDKAESIVKAFAKNFPDKTPIGALGDDFVFPSTSG
mgnify:CR=1 FL=1